MAVGLRGIAVFPSRIIGVNGEAVGEGIGGKTVLPSTIIGIGSGGSTLCLEVAGFLGLGEGLFLGGITLCCSVTGSCGVRLEAVATGNEVICEPAAAGVVWITGLAVVTGGVCAVGKIR